MTQDRSNFFQKSLGEVSGQTPRRLKFRSFKEGRGIWTILLFFLFLVVGLTALVTFGLQGSYISSKYGRPNQATVRETSTYESRHTLHYTVNVAYDLNGSSHEGKVENLGPIPNDIQIGKQVSIHYLPGFLSSPALDKYPPHDYSPLYYFIAMYSLIPIGMFLVMSQFSLLRNGEVHIGQIEDPYRPDGGRVEVAEKEYSVRLPSSRFSQNLYFERKKGEKIIVLVDPKNPSKNAVYTPPYNPFILETK